MNGTRVREPGANVYEHTSTSTYVESHMHTNPQCERDLLLYI